MNDVEEWRPWRDGSYEVSNLGRVRRAKPGRRTEAGRCLKPIRMRIGYLQVGPTVNGRNSVQYVHSMVAECFLGPRPEGLHINHIDGDKSNPRASNLEYVTRAQNMAHASATGLMAHGEQHYAAKLTDEDVRRLLEARANGESLSVLSRRFGVAISHVCNIVRGRARRSAA